MNLGIDQLLRNPKLRKPLEGRRIALLGHPASVTSECRHTLDALIDCLDVRVVAAIRETGTRPMPKRLVANIPEMVYHKR